MVATPGHIWPEMQYILCSEALLCHGHHFAMFPNQEEEEDDLVSRAICSAVADCKYSVSCLIAEQAVS